MLFETIFLLSEIELHLTSPHLSSPRRASFRGRHFTSVFAEIRLFLSVSRLSFRRSFFRTTSRRVCCMKPQFILTSVVQDKLLLCARVQVALHIEAELRREASRPHLSSTLAEHSSTTSLFIYAYKNTQLSFTLPRVQLQCSLHTSSQQQSLHNNKILTTTKSSQQQSPHRLTSFYQTHEAKSSHSEWQHQQSRPFVNNTV